MKRLSASRLSELESAATLGVHLDGMAHVHPAELLALVTEVIESRRRLADVAETMVAPQPRAR